MKLNASNDRAHNRAIVDFCSVDRLLLTTFLTRVGRSVITYTYQIDADYLSSNPTANQVLDDVINATVARTEAALA